MDREYTNGDAADIIENEGLAYAVRHFCSGDDFEDVNTRRLWTLAGLALDSLVAHIERQTGREIDG